MTDFLQPTLESLQQHDIAHTRELPLVPLDITYVVYAPHSTLSLVLAMLTFTPFVILIGLFTLILFRRELEAINHFAGLCVSTIVNQLMKNYFREARPANSVKQGHGMPSDHSQFMGFMACYCIAWLWTRACVRGFERLVYTATLLVLLVFVPVSRVHLEVHTVKQVCAGAVIGLVLGALYFYASSRFLYPHYPRLLALRVSRWVYLKDSSVIPDVLEWEREALIAYQRWIIQQAASSGADSQSQQHMLASQAADEILMHHSHHQSPQSQTSAANGTKKHR